jgi:predicted  nucleic acid-binding Zn-ribbon protein
MDKRAIKESIRAILDIQDLDMKMLRLMRVKKERRKEIAQIGADRQALQQHLTEGQKELEELAKLTQSFEVKIQENQDKTKKLESQQGMIKKSEEFNALTQEMAQLDRDRISLEQKISDLVDKRVSEEDVVKKIKEGLQTSEATSLALEKEIEENIRLINQEGTNLQQQRIALAATADAELLAIYERLLRNKQDRVVVAIENRTCAGCHIALTAQHESLVRKATSIVFCEHCFRLLYWPEVEEVDGAGTGAKRRRRRVAST